MKVSLVSIATLAISTSCDAFLNLPFVNQANPALTKYAEAQEDALLKIHLDIGHVDTKSKFNNPVITGTRLGVDGLVVEMGELCDAAYKHPNLPGADGPNPQLSSGAHKLETLEKGKFVDIFGTQSVNLEHGCWEFIWRRNAKAGAFICAFTVPEEIKRNDAKIPKGRLYVTFPVWTEESLKDLKERKEKAEEVANEARQRLEDETRLMREEPNPLMKAMHFRAACKAHEDIDYSGYRSYNNMPLERDMINLDGLHICSLGTVWTKKDGFMGEHVLLGSASAMAFDPAELAPPEMKVVTRDLLKPTAYDGLRP